MNHTNLRKTALNMATSHDPDDDVMAESVEMAKIIRERQGSFEMEVTCGAEADLHRHMKHCKKNPGHENFVPVGDFKLKHLPPEYQDPDIVEFVKAESDLTVRVYVKCISDKRPKYWIDGKTRYAFYKYRGRKNIGRTGTGFINDVHKYSDNRPCECNTCKTTGQRQKTWGYVEIVTATHVIYDEEEVKNTKCHLFYDTSDTELSNLPTLEGMECIEADYKSDKACMKWCTHDVVLLDRLHKMHTHYGELQKRLHEKYTNITDLSLVTSHDDSSNTNTEHKLTIIVSHPHGCSKMITVGKWTDRKDTGGDDYDDTQYIYTTKTCPGSSGAHVYLIGSGSTLSLAAIHHKGSYESPGLNCSGFGSGYMEIEVIIPYEKVGFIFDECENVHEWLEDATTVYMYPDDLINTSSKHDMVLHLKGHPDRCPRVRQFVLDLLDAKPCSIIFKDKRGNYKICNSSLDLDLDRYRSVVYIEVPRHDVSLVKGEDNTMIKKIKKETKTSIKFTYDDGRSENCLCFVTGRKERVQPAVDMIQNVWFTAKTKRKEIGFAGVTGDPRRSSGHFCTLGSQNGEEKPIIQGHRGGHDDRSSQAYQLKILKVVDYPQCSWWDSDYSDYSDDKDDVYEDQDTEEEETI